MSILIHRRFRGLVGGLYLSLIILPYLSAWAMAGSNHVFGGFLLNPIDGNTYLAKMYQGWRGDWLFTLPFTVEPGTGNFLFFFYIFSGHLARLTGISLIAFFHLIRIAAALVLLVALDRFFRAIFFNPVDANLGFALAALGSGMGWLATVIGYFTSDLWVAEAYPFLSGFANPHFPLGLAMMLWLLTLSQKELSVNSPASVGLRGGSGWSLQTSARRNVRYGIAAFALAIVLPFGVVLAVCILSGVLALEFFLYRSAKSDPDRLVWIALGGVPLVLYEWWVTITDPLLSLWNAQNLTPAPAAWDFLTSFSPLLILAAIGVWVWLSKIAKAEGSLEMRMQVAVVWVLTGIIFLFLPIGLQRRFLMGLYIPLAALAILGLRQLAGNRPARHRLLVALLFLLVLPTNVLVLLVGQFGAAQQDARLYLYRDELAAFEWIRQNTAPDAVVLAAPDTGLLVPAYTGRRVVYGHPFETLQAEEKRARVVHFFTSGGPAELAESLFDPLAEAYIFYGPRERALGDIWLLQGFEVVFSSPEVELLRMESSPPLSMLGATVRLIR